jgi:hypothetical protein
VNTPGTTMLCRTCTKRVDERANEGHPQPCAEVRWDGPRHLRPHLQIVGDEVRCEEYQARE